jgi:hypothetical protein
MRSAPAAAAASASEDGSDLQPGQMHRACSRCTRCAQQATIGSWCAGPGTEDKDAASVRADTPVPPDCGVYYYEVTVINPGRECCIGARPTSARRTSPLPGRTSRVCSAVLPRPRAQGPDPRPLLRSPLPWRTGPLGVRVPARRRHRVCHVGGTDGPAARLGQPQLWVPRRRRLRVQRLRQGQRVRADVQHGCARLRAWTPCLPARPASQTASLAPDTSAAAVAVRASARAAHALRALQRQRGAQAT